MALDCGIQATQFWDLSLFEIFDIVESHRRIQTREKKERITEQFTMAEVIANRVGYVFSDPNKRRESDITWPWDYYPELFSEEAEAREKRIAEAETEAIKAVMEARIRAVNAKFGGN